MFGGPERSRGQVQRSHGLSAGALGRTEAYCSQDNGGG
jgi:hypothetical protein